MRLWSCLATMMFALSCPGCGSDGPPPVATGAVTGKVTFNGAAVTEGTVSFYNNEKGTAAHGKIGADGSYSATGAALGANVVIVRPPEPEIVEGIESGKEPPPPKSYPNIPARYRDAASSGFTFEVKDSDNTFDIEMK